MLGSDFRGLGCQVVAEQVAVEVVAELREELVQSRFGVGSWLPAEDVTQVFCVPDVDAGEVVAVDHSAVEQVTGEDETAEQRVQNVRFETSGGHLVQPLAGGLQVPEEVPVHSLPGIERPSVDVEVFAGLDGQNELLEFPRHAVQLLDESFGNIGRATELGLRQPGIDVDFIRRNQNEDRGDALVPELATEFDDLRRFNRVHLPEVNDWGIVLAENPVELKLLKGAAEDVRLWSRDPVGTDLIHAGEQGGRFPVADAKLHSPVSERHGGHVLDDPFCWATFAGSPRSS